MLHNTLSALLVSLTSRYAQLSPSDVGIGIGGGRLVIDNVQLRADTFNGPHLPFHVHHGRAGRLRVNVPWRALSSTPVQLYLENVHLIAGPKLPSTATSHTSTTNKSDTNNSTQATSSNLSQPPLPPLPFSSTSNRDQRPVPWHQTNIGRLLFNVSVEIYGLKVEYRDDHCIAVLSIASLRASSAGPDWNMRFVSLAPDLDHDQPDATAVSMRKTVDLTGVHFVMIPRAAATPDIPISSTESVSATFKADNTSPKNNSETSTSKGSEPLQEKSELDHPGRNLDLNSFESKSPILDGASISLRVLLCTGVTVLPSTPNVLTAGMHGEISIEIDDPTVRLTARQLNWLDDILKQALSVVQVESTVSLDAKHNSSRPDLNFIGESTHAETSDSMSSSPHAQQLPPDPSENVDSDNTTETTNITNTDKDLIPNSLHTARRRKRASGLMSVWEAIVGENSDETVDDAAIVLGLWDGEEGPLEDGGEDVGDSSDRDENPQDTTADNKPTPQHSKRNPNISEDNEGEGKDSESADKQYARQMVATAAKCGGVTWEVRLRTTDTRALDRANDLEREMLKAQTRAEVAEAQIKEVHNFKAQAHETLMRAEAAEQRVNELVSRNSELIRELQELERLSGEASRSKDAMIREMQSTLATTERELQSLYEQNASKDDEEKQAMNKTEESDSNSVDSYSKRQPGKLDGDLDTEEKEHFDDVTFPQEQNNEYNHTDENNNRNYNGVEAKVSAIVLNGDATGLERPSDTYETQKEDSFSTAKTESLNEGKFEFVPTEGKVHQDEQQSLSQQQTDVGSMVNHVRRTEDKSTIDRASLGRRSVDAMSGMEEVPLGKSTLDLNPKSSTQRDIDLELTGDGIQTKPIPNTPPRGDLHRMHPANFDMLQQEMGHEGLTLI